MAAPCSTPARIVASTASSWWWMLDRIRSVSFAAAECSHAFTRARAARMRFNSGLGDTDRMIPHFVPSWVNPKKILSRKRTRAIAFGSTRFLSRVAEPAHDLGRQRSDRVEEPCAAARARPHVAKQKASVSRRSEPSLFPAVAERRSRGRGPRRHDRDGNFPPCKALKTHKMRKESRFCASPFHRPAKRGSR